MWHGSLYITALAAQPSRILIHGNEVKKRQRSHCPKALHSKLASLSHHKAVHLVNKTEIQKQQLCPLTRKYKAKLTIQLLVSLYSNLSSGPFGTCAVQCSVSGDMKAAASVQCVLKWGELWCYWVSRDHTCCLVAGLDDNLCANVHVGHTVDTHGSYGCIRPLGASLAVSYPGTWWAEFHPISLDGHLFCVLQHCTHQSQLKMFHLSLNSDQTVYWAGLDDCELYN